MKRLVMQYNCKAYIGQDIIFNDLYQAVCIQLSNKITHLWLPGINACTASINMYTHPQSIYEDNISDPRHEVLETDRDRFNPFCFLLLVCWSFWFLIHSILCEVNKLYKIFLSKLHHTSFKQFHNKFKRVSFILSNIINFNRRTSRATKLTM